MSQPRRPPALSRALTTLCLLALLSACGGRDQEASAPPPEPAPSAPSPAVGGDTAPAAGTSAGALVPDSCSLLSPADLERLTGYTATLHQPKANEPSNPRLSNCSWKLAAAKPVILSLTVRANPRPKKLTTWAQEIIAKQVAEGRTDKKGTHFAYQTLPGLGSAAAWSPLDAQLRWAHENRLIFTLRTQKPDLLTKDAFLAIAQEVDGKA